MLKALNIKNFAIIDNIELSFYNGMTALTGQTGAGKSLIIDSINLLLGSRADLDMVRYGEKSAIIKGIFDVNDKIRECLKKYDIKSDELIIERTISKKNQIKVNDVSITLNELKEIGRLLADVHSQEDTYKLINPDNYIGIIDSYKKIDKSKYLEALFNYSEQLKKYNQIINKNKALNEKLDLLKFQYDELKALNLKENELEELLIKEEKLKNHDKIYRSLVDALNLLDNEAYSISNIYDAAKSIKQIKEYDKGYNEIFEILNNSYYEIDSCIESLRKGIDQSEFDPIEFENISSRINELKNIERKYNKNIKELIKYFDEIKYEIDLQLNYDELVKENYNLLLELFEKCLNEAKKLTNERIISAKEIEKSLILECEDLDLHNVDFSIEIEELKPNPLINSFLEDGINCVDFLISLNIGEPKKSLHKVASGGELSRIMLGLKDVIARCNNLPLMVFDEIDTGISGSTAKKIAKKIKSISKYTQVLAITHQPQVASAADNQLMVNKCIENERTYTIAKYLNKEERIKEIALMLNGSLSMASLEGAKELLEL